MKRRIGPFAIARDLASALSVIERSLVIAVASDGVASSFVGEQLRGRNFAGLLDFLRQLLRAQLAHGEELEHAILHVLESVVILLEHRLRVLEIELIVGPLVPRKLRDPLEIRADHLRLHRLAAGALQPPELALYFRARLLRQLELGRACREAP